ncbi:signal peptidase I [Hyphococcus luteus]|uniref:Signal peptidase I n=1 Tax=Hyphococcus luteus TaxID=2058213 RepID=A0A2S7K1Q7_9PROT|nr:signal peptidase I [Marinicaulis flavus]PQA86444.1 signal peptidase I [Marinicaulis flavus]
MSTSEESGPIAEKTSAKPAETPMTAAEEAWDLAKTVLFAVAIALVLRIIIFQPFNIPSGSMKPTLLVGDFLVVSKPTFGYSKASLVYPLTRLPVDGRILAFGKPKRGDVVVFKNRKDGNKDYIKRVIGLPGDKIQVLGGRLHINDKPVKKELVAAEVSDVCGPGWGAPEYRETLDNGVSYIVQECAGDDGPLDNTSAYHVPAGHYFMMGDNRDQSQDSRVISQVGYVPQDALVGRAERLFFSVDGQETRLWTPWKWPFAVRYGRIFDPVK